MNAHIPARELTRVDAAALERHFVALEPADAATHFGAVFAQRVALFDYVLKAQRATARRLVGSLRPAAASPAPER